MNYYLALTSMLKGEQKMYEFYTNIVKEKGTEFNERDKEALYDAKIDYPLCVSLVKARLLLAGGYTDEAGIYLNDFDSTTCSNPIQQIEYYFLLAIYNEEKQNYSRSIELFKYVINHGKDKKYQFACEASLRLSEIYERMKNIKNAKVYYKKSIDLYNNDYYEYLEVKAKKAYNRLKS